MTKCLTLIFTTYISRYLPVVTNLWVQVSWIQFFLWTNHPMSKRPLSLYRPTISHPPRAGSANPKTNPLIVLYIDSALLPFCINDLTWKWTLNLIFLTNKNKRREEEGEAVLQASSFVNQEEASDSRNSDRPVLDSFDDFFQIWFVVQSEPIISFYPFFCVLYHPVALCMIMKIMILEKCKIFEFNDFSLWFLTFMISAWRHRLVMDALTLIGAPTRSMKSGYWSVI